MVFPDQAVAAVVPRDPSRPLAAVIGAAGFIGSHLVTALSASGVPAVAFTRAMPLVHHGRPVPALRDAAVIFFLASSITPAVAASHPGRVAADHRLLASLLEALHRDGTRPAFVFAGSGGTVYAPDAARPYTEQSTASPVCAYGRAKLRMEQTLTAWARAVRPLIVRASTVYGPGQRPRGAQGVVAHWLAAARAGEPLRLFGDPRTCRDYVYVADLVEALLAVYRLVGPPEWEPSPGPVLTVNVGSGIRTSLIEVLTAVVATVPPPVPVTFEAPRGFDRGDVWLDVTSAARQLGWAPRTSLALGVAETWRAMEPGMTSMAHNGVYPSVVPTTAE